ncbi:putative aminoadipate reductase [Mycena belliarum]|uniref:Aminoadipate reductase n=1 Tax=Mycena belliarum TaxID=1033014 RepID=A0AAD6TRJ3_9AGAR|nr:putative aminoadipate reductase [Mycena belliae]
MPTTRPPLDCSLNLGQIIDLHIVNENRDAAYAFSDEAGNITEISKFEFGRAAHRAAHLLRPQRGGVEGQTVAIAALTDVLIYHSLVAGCVIAGIVPFAVSHRNSAAAMLHLLSSTGAHRLVTTKGSLGHFIDAVVSESSAMSPPYKLSIEEIPLLGQIYPHLGRETVEDAFVPFPEPATKAALDNVALYLHSSGSTGFPKPIPWTHRTVIHFAALDILTEWLEICPRHACGALPPFHSLGTIFQFIFPILAGGTSCIYPPASTSSEYLVPVTPTPENALDNARKARATGIAAVPSMILQWQSPEHVAYLKTLNIVGTGGGPLSAQVGDSLVSQGVKLVSVYGTTEIGGPLTVKGRLAEMDVGEWVWMEFSSRVNIRWVPQGDGIFESQFLTVPDAHQPAVENLPDVKGYSTKDLWERHPTKPSLYRLVGRLDDVIILANGEKTVPGPMEDIMMSSPLITGAVVFGRERNQVGVLIEPAPTHQLDPKDEQQLAKFRNLIWPVLEEANKDAPAFSRIYKEMILVVSPGKPMLRAPKGTVIKKQTVELYNKEIETLYETIDASRNATSDVEPPASWTIPDLVPWLTMHTSLITGRDISVGLDLFDHGFDSLNATFLRHRIVGALTFAEDKAANAVAQKIPQNFVYSHPSIEQLAIAIADLMASNDSGPNLGSKTVVENMIAKYSQGCDEPLKSAKHPSSGRAVVLLTGSTGGLGSHILEMLLGLPTVERVYAFNRKGRSPVSDRQKEVFVDRSLDLTVLSSEKLVYVEGDTYESDLGLHADVYNNIRDTVTVIIHNAWMLDFNKSLSSFEPHVKGTRNLIELARLSPQASTIRFLFTSSIGTAQRWDQNLGPFPEELQPDAEAAIGNGYSESKYISERILAVSGLQSTSFRIGQITGSMSNGAWASSDWLPALVKSSIALGGFPANPSDLISWIAPETVARTIIDAALSADRPPLTVNVVHPRPVPWDTVMTHMARIAHCELMPFADWVRRLEMRAAHATAEDMKDIPGIKLLDFITTMAATPESTRFSTVKAQTLSSTMRSAGSLDLNDAERWMRYWRAAGFISFP